MCTSYLENSAHFSQVLSGPQKAERQNRTHVFRDGIEMRYEPIWNLNNAKNDSLTCSHVHSFVLLHKFAYMNCLKMWHSTPLEILQF